MRPLPNLSREWLSIVLPGYREPSEYITYAGFAYDDLPPIERELDDELHWLLREPVVKGSLVAVDADATTPATREGLLNVVGSELTLPPAFLAFVSSDEPRSRIRSCTDCYLDLGDFAVPVVGGGSLIHFLSDSQWVLHWLLYVGPDGTQAVVASDLPLGFELSEGEKTVRLFDVAEPGPAICAVCADSFIDFLYRFWIENEIWFNLAAPDGDLKPLTQEQLQYVEHYVR